MKKFLISASLIFILIVGVVTAYIFNVDAQKVKNEIPVNEPVIEEPAVEDNAGNSDEQNELIATYIARYGFNETSSLQSQYGGIWDVSYPIMYKRWNNEKFAMEVEMLDPNANITGRHYVIYTPIDILTAAKDIGVNSISFTVSSDNGAFLTEGKGLRVYSKTVADIDNAGIEDNADEGIFVYGDFGTAADVTKFLVTIDISDFLALNEDAKYLGIVVNIPNGTKAYFSDLAFNNSIINTEYGQVDLIFANNSWETIATVFKAGKAGEYWHLGDTKEITLTDGYTYAVRIADMYKGRYAYADGSGRSNGVLEFVNCLSSFSKMNDDNTNLGGWADSFQYTELNTRIYDRLPDDLKAVISEVLIAGGVGGGTTAGISYSNNKLFLASEFEIFGEKTYSIGASEGSPQFGYWALHSSDADRVKMQINATSATYWWLRSPCSGSSTYFCLVDDSGPANGYIANYGYGICPFFAF